MDVLPKYSNKYIILGLCILVSILIGYLVSSSFRTSLTLKRFRSFPQSTISYGTDYCSSYFQNRPLSDFHVFSSATTGSIGFTKYDYMSNKFIEDILRSGARYIEFTILSENQNSNAEPVIGIGKQKGNQTLSINLLKIEDVFAVIQQVAFSRMSIINYTDPLFIFFDLQTNKREVQDKLYQKIMDNFQDKILPKKERDVPNISIIPMCNLMNHIIFFSSAVHTDSKLKSIISLTTDSPYLKRIHYSDLLLQKTYGNQEFPEFFIETTDISFHKGIGDPYIQINDPNVNMLEQGLRKDMRISVSGAKNINNNTIDGEGTPYLLIIKQITPRKIVFDSVENPKWKAMSEKSDKKINIRGFYVNKTREGLTDFNKGGLTIVIPDENIFPNNYIPKNAWYMGCQFVALHFQTNNENWKNNKYFFRKRAIRMKQNTLLSSMKGRQKEETKGHPLSLEPDPIPPPKYDIDFSILKKIIGRSIYIEPLLNDKLKKEKEKPVKLIKNGNGLGMGPVVSSRKSILYPQPSKNYKNNGMITLRNSNEEFLAFDEEGGKLTWIKNKCNNNPLALVDFNMKTNFIIEREKIRNSNSYRIAYVKHIKGTDREPPREKLLYLNYDETYRPSKMIYTMNTKNYEKIGVIQSGGTSAWVWRPIPHFGYFPIGDVITTSEKQPTEMAVLVSGGISKPIDFTLIWDNKGLELEKTNSKPLSIWKPVPPENLPSGAYHSFGVVVQNNYTKPDTNGNAIRCVLAKYTKLSSYRSSSGSNYDIKGRYTKIINNDELSFWKGTGMNYMVPSLRSEGGPIVPPNELDFPLYDIRYIHSPQSLDLITLTENDRNTGSHFRINVETRGGAVPINQEIYDKIAELPNNDDENKMKMPINYKNGDKRCLNIPDGFWSKSLEELKKLGSNKPKLDRKIYSILPKDTCPKESIKGQIEFLAEENVCRELGGAVIPERYSTQNNVKCGLDICDTHKQNFKTFNTKGMCNSGDKIGNVLLPVQSQNDCSVLGGNFKNINNKLYCEFDSCRGYSTNSMLFSSKNGEGNDKNEDDYGISPKVNNQNNVNNQNKPVRVSFLNGLSSADILMEPCRDDSYLGTNYKYSSVDKRIRTLQNPDYCVTAPGENAISKSMYLTKCDSENSNQSFVYNDKKQIILDSKINEQGKAYCVNGNYNNTTSLKLCEDPIPFRQKWELSESNPEYCIRIGSKVLIFLKEEREKMENKSNTLSPPIDNILNERFDFQAIHYWLEGKVRNIIDGQYIVDVEIRDGTDVIYAKKEQNAYKIPVTSSLIVPSLDIEYQLNTEPKKGDKVLVQNGHLSIKSGQDNIILPEDVIYWEGVVLDKNPNVDNLYKIAFSVNSAEPNNNNKNKGRDEQAGVKYVNLSKIRFHKRAGVCLSSM